MIARRGVLALALLTALCASALRASDGLSLQ